MKKVSQTLRRCLIKLYLQKLPAEINSVTETFLHHSKMHENIIKDGPNEDLITVKQCNDFWNKTKEKTQSSKSNKHVGSNKAATKNVTNSIIEARLMSNLYQTGYSLQRWQKSLNVLLFKNRRSIHRRIYVPSGTWKQTAMEVARYILLAA